jgi:hypothetical protein
VRWKKDHQQADHADEIIMIQICAFVDELDVSKCQEQRGDREPVIQAQSHKQC